MARNKANKMVNKIQPYIVSLHIYSLLKISFFFLFFFNFNHETKNKCKSVIRQWKSTNLRCIHILHTIKWKNAVILLKLRSQISSDYNIKKWRNTLIHTAKSLICLAKLWAFNEYYFFSFNSEQYNFIFS